jgi:hypothetical protein
MGLIVTLIVIVLAVAVAVALAKLLLGLAVLIVGAIAVWWAWRKIQGPKTSSHMVSGSSDRSEITSR